MLTCSQAENMSPSKSSNQVLATSSKGSFAIAYPPALFTIHKFEGFQMLSAANEGGAGGHQATETNRPIATTQPFAATTNKVSEYVPVTTKKYDCTAFMNDEENDNYDYFQ